MNNFSNGPAISTIKGSQDPPHIQRARELAQLIFSEHPPHEQNEMINTIVVTITMLREQEQSSLKDRLNFLQQDFDNLTDLTVKLPKIQQ